MPTIYPKTILVVLAWTVIYLTVQMGLLILVGAWIQHREKFFNRYRIERHKRWEDLMSQYLFAKDGEHDPSIFGELSIKEQKLFLPFIIRVLGLLKGREAQAVRTLYRSLALDKGLDGRLRSFSPKIQALAALEIGYFSLHERAGDLRKLLLSPVPFVAYTAAKSLASLQDLKDAQAVIDWALRQDMFQHERLIWIMEEFGPDIVPWLEPHLTKINADPRILVIYATLAASFKMLEALPNLIELLFFEDVEVQSAAIKALGILGIPDGLPVIMRFTSHESWIIRAQAAKTMGIFSDPRAIPKLLDLMTDSVYEVRRNAARALVRIGRAGLSALDWVAKDPSSDEFARDLAIERLEWAGDDRH